MWNYCRDSVYILSNELSNGNKFIKSLELQAPSRMTIMWGFCWITGYIMSIWMKFGSIYFIFTMIIGIFLNLGVKQNGEASAYSVFNQGYERILGTMTADQFEREIRHDDHFGEEYHDEDRLLPEGDEVPRRHEEKKNKNMYRKKGKKSNRI